MEAQAEADRAHNKDRGGKHNKGLRRLHGTRTKLRAIQHTGAKDEDCVTHMACGALDLELLAHSLTWTWSPCHGAACEDCDAVPAGQTSSSNVAEGVTFLWIQAQPFEARAVDCCAHLLAGQ